MPTQHLQKTHIQPPRVDERAPAPHEMQGLELAVSGWMATEDEPETARVLTLRFVIPGNEKATFELSVSSDSTIASLKSKCHSALVGPRDAAAAEGGEEAKEETGAKETKEATEAGTTPPHRFLYKGRELSVSSSTVESYNLEDGHTVHLIPAAGTTIAAPRRRRRRRRRRRHHKRPHCHCLADAASAGRGYIRCSRVLLPHHTKCHA